MWKVLKENFRIGAQKTCAEREENWNGPMNKCFFFEAMTKMKNHCTYEVLKRLPSCNNTSKVNRFSLNETVWKVLKENCGIYTQQR